MSRIDVAIGLIGEVFNSLAFQNVGNGRWKLQTAVPLIRAERDALRTALEEIIERSHNGELGSSKVIDMRNIATKALKGLE